MSMADEAKSRREEILNDLYEAIEELERVEEESSGTEPTYFTLSDSAVSFLLSSLAQVVEYGIKNQEKLFQSNQKLHFWDYACQLPECLPDGHTILNSISSLRSVRTKTGAGRVFLCKALNDSELNTILSALIYNESLTKKYYEEYSILCAEPSRGHFLSLTERLSQFHFQLTLQDTSSLEVAQLAHSQPLSKQEIEEKILTAQAEQERRKEVEIANQKADEAEQQLWGGRLGKEPDALVVEHLPKKRRGKRVKKSKGSRKSTPVIADIEDDILTSEPEERSKSTLLEQAIEQPSPDAVVSPSTEETEPIEEESPVVEEEEEKRSNDAILQLYRQYGNLSEAQQIMYELLVEDPLPTADAIPIAENFPASLQPGSDLIGFLIKVEGKGSLGLHRRSTNPAISMLQQASQNASATANPHPAIPPSPLRKSAERKPSLSDDLDPTKLDVSPLSSPTITPLPLKEESSESEDVARTIPRGNKVPLVVTLSQQNNAEATGECQCGVTLTKSARFCEYYGKYFCTNCHLNQESSIPARIVYHYDFSRYPVSEAAIAILRESLHSPEIVVPKSLYAQSRRIARAKELRNMLSRMTVYLKDCGQREALLKKASNDPHLLEDNDVYSLRNLIEAKQDKLVAFLSSLCVEFSEHIRSCPSCSSLGQICVVCRTGKPLYTFDKKKVVTICRGCGTLYHNDCYKKQRPLCCDDPYPLP